MPQVHLTTQDANLRSTPHNPGDLSNRIVVLPGGHWVHLLGVQAGKWGHVWTILKNRQYDGYVHLSLLTGTSEQRRYDVLETVEVFRQRIFADEEGAVLKKFLSIAPPGGGKGARPAEATSIARSRQVELDWDYIFSPRLIRDYHGTNDVQPFARASNIDYFIDYFNAQWGLSESTFGMIRDKIWKKVSVNLPRIRTVPNTVKGVPRFEYVYEAVPDAFVLVHALSDRYYLLRAKNPAQTPIQEQDFASFDAFMRMMDEKVQDVVHVVDAQSQIPARMFVNEVEEVDLAPSIILREFSELDSIKEFTTSLDQQATEFGKKQVGGLLTDQEINTLIYGVLRMKSPKVERRVALERLADRASDLGYILNIDDTNKEFKYEDGSKITLVPGQLYRPYITRIYWTTEHRRVRERRSFSFGFGGIGWGTQRETWVERITHSKEVVKYRTEAVDRDPWTERQDELLKAEGLTSFRFEKQGADYRTASGESLNEIIARCDRDEEFRQQTAIWIPVYEQKFTRGEVLTKYIIFKRPYRGIMPVQFPRLYVEEALSYRTAWQSSELGELVYTINLAPGEERSVTIDQKVSKQVEETRSTTSILDLTESDSTDLSTEIEREAKSSVETSRSTSWSASASGSFGPIGGAASASGESKTTTAQFARNMERIARKAAQNITRNTKQEVKSSTTIRADFSRSESTSIKIKNINEGRTLNLLFFRLFNLYNAGVYVDNIKLLAEDGIEVVAGSGVTIPRLFDLSELGEALSVFDLGNLPYSAAAAPGTEGYAMLFNAYWSYILDEFVRLLGTEYRLDPKNQAGILAFGETLQKELGALLEGENRRSLRLDFGGGQDRFDVENLYMTLHREIRRLEKALAEAVASSEAGIRALAPHELRVASPGLYVDTFMGVRPATEPYSEEMRAQQVRQRSAETNRIQAMANYYNSLALNGPYSGDAAANGPVVVGQIVSDRSVALEFRGGVPSGRWTLEVDGTPVQQTRIDDGQTRAVMEWSDAQPWLTSPDEHTYLLVGPDGTLALHLLLIPEYGLEDGA